MVRFAARIVAGVLLCTVGLAAPPAAQEQYDHPVSEAPDARMVQIPAPGPLVRSEPAKADRRPAVLVPLYAGFAALQVLDAHSTTRALGRGAAESNPLMRPFAGSTAGLLAVKAGAATGVIYASEKIRKKNKTAAIVFMIATNSAMAWVVQHNYRAVR